MLIYLKGEREELIFTLNDLYFPFGWLKIMYSNPLDILVSNLKYNLGFDSTTKIRKEIQ